MMEWHEYVIMAVICWIPLAISVSWVLGSVTRALDGRRRLNLTDLIVFLSALCFLVSGLAYGTLAGRS
jgi:p-aminobenzoyl-glutamate transporter AbgT